MDTGATTGTAIPQVYYNNAGTPTNDAVSNHNHSSSPISSVIITIIILSSIIIISAIVYFLIRFFSSRTTVSPVSEHQNENEDAHHQVQIALDNKDLNWLPVFTYSSITGNKLSGGDCAVCLTKFEAKDRLRRLPLCCHAFHVECIDPWLKSNHTCPLCRSSINPTEADIMKKTGYNGNNNNNNSLRIEIGTISRRRDPSESESDRTSYSLGSYAYVIDDGYEIPVESAHRRDFSGDKDEPAVDIAGDGGNRNWLHDYVDRLSSRTMSFGGSGRFFTGSSRRSEVVDYEVAHGRIGEEISEYFRWLSGV